MSETAPFTPADRLNSLIERLMQDVAREAIWGAVVIPLIKLLFRRFRRLNRRFATILARLHAGTPPAARRAPAPPRAPAPCTPDPSLRVGFVLHMFPATAAERHDLEALLDDPDTEALLADAPQLGRVLRPLCRMLAVKPPSWLCLPRRPRAPVKKFPPAPEWLVNEPGAILAADGSVWMRLGASTLWRPGLGHTLEQAQKFDSPRRIWPRDE